MILKHDKHDATTRAHSSAEHKAIPILEKQELHGCHFILSTWIYHPSLLGKNTNATLRSFASTFLFKMQLSPGGLFHGLMTTDSYVVYTSKCWKKEVLKVCTTEK
jgi:hypothetical protein